MTNTGNKKSKDNSKNTKKEWPKITLIIIVILLLCITIGYIIFIFEAYKKKKFIFAPYKRPALSSDYKPFSITGKITPLTADEKYDRCKYIASQIPEYANDTDKLEEFCKQK